MYVQVAISTTFADASCIGFHQLSVSHLRRHTSVLAQEVLYLTAHGLVFCWVFVRLLGNCSLGTYFLIASIAHLRSQEV